MKKIISLLLAAVLVLSLAACAPTDNDGTAGNDGTTSVSGTDYSGQLLVGYGRADITTMDSLPLQGFGDTHNRMSTGIWSKMYQIAVAITDPQGNTAILIAADACWFNDETTTDIANKIEKELGVPADQVIISAIHQHSAPDMYNEKAPSGISYREKVFIPGAVAAAKAAMDNRAPAKVQTATVETESMNFVRHYVMSDGSYAGNNFGDWTLTAVKHAAEVDNDLQLVKFIREGQTTMDGKKAKDIILSNFQGHPLMGVSGASFNIMHSDLVGIYRDTLEEELDCHAIYFSGASANVNFTSDIKSENKSSDYKAHGKKLAKYAVEAEGTYTDVEITAVKATKVNFTGNCNHSEDNRLEEAKKAQEEYNQSGDIKVAQKYGFQSIYHFGAIIGHAKLPETRSFDLFALSFGDIAFVAAPYEMFSESGEAIKAASPFKMTLIATIANGGQEYMPTQTAWDYGCYEQYNSNYDRGTAEKLVEEYGKMLETLHG